MMEFLANLFESVKTWVSDTWKKVVDFFTPETNTELAENPVYKAVAWIVSSIPVVVAAGMTFVWPFVFFGTLTGASPLLIPLLIAVNAMYWLFPAFKAGFRAIDGDFVALALQAFSWVAIIPLFIGVSIILGGGSPLAIPVAVQLFGTIPLFIRAFWATVSW